MGTITSSHIKARSNANEEVLYILYRSTIRAKRSDAVSYQTQDSSCIWLIDDTQTDITTASQSITWSNAMKRYSTFPKALELEPLH